MICRRAAATRKSRETLPTGANAAKRQRVYGGKNDDVALILPYAAPYFARLAHPMQDVHSGQQGVLELGP